MAAVEEARRPTGIGELDRVLGGGAVPGSVILVGGEPGIGKSTLLLAFAAQAGADALYVAGEESPAQVARRARRLGYGESELALIDCTKSEVIAALLRESRPAFAVVDSVQTLRSEGVDGAPGQPAQMRAAAERLVPAARDSGTALLLVGQVTKEGGLAGPRALEHAVDVVCHLEGDRQMQIRALRGLKNRYGPTDETGLFEMREQGMVELRQASAALLADRGEPGPGAVVGVALAGRRALCLEAQALCVPNKIGPKRRGQGIDGRRLEVLVGCVQSDLAPSLAEHDVYVNVVGGLAIRDPGLDLAVVAAILGEQRSEAIAADAVAIGEVGLRGEVRGVGQMTARLKEARAMGFRRAYVPARTEKVDGIELVEVRRFDEVLGPV
ncbi:MAG: ATPase domain-containing protein [Planctomycetota bacterium]